MQVKKFEAPTMAEALETIKRELGPEAVILQTKNNKKGFGLLSKTSVEVTAAVADKAMLKKKVLDTIAPSAKRAELDKMPAHLQAQVYDKVEIQRRAHAKAASAKAAAPASSAAATPARSKITATRYIDIGDGEKSVPRLAAPTQVTRAIKEGAEARGNIEQEIDSLRKLVQDLKKAQEGFAGPLASGSDLPTALPGALSDVLEQLTLNGLDRRYALSLIRRVRTVLGEAKCHDSEAILDQLAIEVMEETEVLPLLKGIRTKEDKGFSTDSQFIALVGPTGVGKTTTLAKIASEAILKRGMKVGLINVDTYKVAAHDQLATYAKILNVPFRSVANSEELSLALQDFNNFDLVLIDTTGRSQKDLESLNQMKNLLQGFPQIRTELVLSATTRDQELYEMGSRFGIFKPEGLIVSKLDEASIYGAVYNISQRLKLPLMYFTTGQRVPEDLEEASKERMAALIMDL